MATGCAEILTHDVPSIGMDRNNQILPIVFGFGKTKSRDSWIWFLSRLENSQFQSNDHLSCVSECISRTLLLTKIGKQDTTKLCFGWLQKLVESLILEKAWLGYIVSYLIIVVHRYM
uniref:MULE transposase domain-containing protein n=1 Tax=Lactuca sativa TaxID=4236 RepID=A0A9R1V9M4_LACSA|nr:hypothetical protein LSAT_V11C600302090 [Lactuca sativa]